MWRVDLVRGAGHWARRRSKGRAGRVRMVLGMVHLLDLLVGLRRILLRWRKLLLIVERVWWQRCELLRQWGLLRGRAELRILLLLLLVEQFARMEALLQIRMQGQPLRIIEGSVWALLQIREAPGLHRCLSVQLV